MMWGYGSNMGWMMWLWGVLLLVAVRLSGTGRTPERHPEPRQLPGPEAGRTRAQQILDERFARGELSEEEYRERLRVLGEGR
ncbi:SHOCT domain-containing protein [Pseudarthrobacter oxydans]|jgi:putative membrane protein|uniref:SHOCT domain-containing protein n=1 Tax=Pseudarthrobacter oxydans TaxID=1671 RepID=UPI0037FA26A4